MCREHHGLWKCENFKMMTANERWNVAMEHKLCFRCLSDGHRGESCFQSKTCGINGCRSHHHPMLHEEPAPRVNNQEQLRVDPPNALTSVTSGPAREGEPTERTHTTTTLVEPAPLYQICGTVNCLYVHRCRTQTCANPRTGAWH